PNPFLHKIPRGSTKPPFSLSILTFLSTSRETLARENPEEGWLPLHAHRHFNPASHRDRPTNLSVVSVTHNRRQSSPETNTTELKSPADTAPRRSHLPFLSLL
ncbi:hypothetical protein V8G54_001969, partial [Vigna mungo]